MELFIVSTLLIFRVVSFMVIFTDGNYLARFFSPISFSLSSLPYVNAVLLFLIIIEMKS